MTWLICFMVANCILQLITHLRKMIFLTIKPLTDLPTQMTILNAIIRFNNELCVSWKDFLLAACKIKNIPHKLLLGFC